MPRKTKIDRSRNGQCDNDTHRCFAVEASVDTAIDQIRYWHRQRVFAMEMRKRVNLALGAFLRLQLGWSLEKPEAERKKIVKAAAALLKKNAVSEWRELIDATKAAAEPMVSVERKALKHMELLAISLPIWPAFGRDIRGFGAASLAVIVGEAGDLANYSNPAKLWKRMGLAVLGGIRQGGLPKGSAAEDWIAHGYSAQRRSLMWNIGVALIKGNRNGSYRALYLERKRYEKERDPKLKPLIAHRRAQRYMEKRLLKNLWQAWRRTMAAANTRAEMSAATPSASAEPRTKLAVPSIRALSAATSPAGQS
jgi:hypothetical protein